MIAKKNMFRFPQPEGTERICSHCGKVLNSEEKLSLSPYAFMHTCKKHKYLSCIPQWKSFRLPRKLKKHFKKIYPNTVCKRSLYQNIVGFDNKDFVFVFRGRQHKGDKYITEYIEKTA